eukprot:6185786-Pleurochrysis_carterae.AAC.3
MTWLRTAIGAVEGPCVPPPQRRSGTLASAAISITWRSYREAVVKSRDAILKELVYYGPIDIAN